MKYVAYFRVSTQKQEKSGLGLEVQQEKVRNFVEKQSDIIAEYVDIQSGKANNRAELEKALNLCKKTGASLLLHKLDRFSRRVSFIASMMEQGVKLSIVDMPHASDFQLHIFAALSQEERRLISERTKAALQKAKERGVILGKNGHVLGQENKKKAIMFANSLKSIVVGYRKLGLGYSAIARQLNADCIKSASGKKFYPATVRNLVSYL